MTRWKNGVQVEMSDYIKRSTAIEIAQSNLNTLSIIKMIENLPSANVAPVRHGRWIEDKIQNHVEKTCHCSECDCQAWGEDEKTHYCPNCGARMDGKLEKERTE